MKTHIFPLVLVCLMLALPLIARAEHKPHVTWFGFNYPPYYIPEGELANTGIHDVARKLFIKALPQYEHTVTTLNTTRLIQSFKSRDQSVIYCVPGSAPIPGLTHVLYTNAMYHTAPEGLIVHESSPLYQQGAEISLKDVLKDGRFTIGYLKASSVSPMVLELIEEYAKNTVTIQQTAPLKSLRMLEVQSVNGVIHFPLTYKSMLETYPRLSHLRFMKIKEQGNFGYPISAYCMDNKAGRQFVKELNQIIARPGFSDTLQDRMTYFIEHR